MANGNAERPSLESVEDVAARFGVSVRTVRRWLAETDIPHRQPGGPGTAVRFDLDEVDAWAARGGRPIEAVDEGVA